MRGFRENLGPWKAGLASLLTGRARADWCGHEQ